MMLPKNIPITFIILATLINSAGATAKENSLNASRKTNVPFIGCKSDGQVGPQPAPTSTEQSVHVDAAAAARLAYYASSTDAVLAPRGWHGFGWYGSNGSHLVVAPANVKVTEPQLNLSGEGIEAAGSEASTSGRFEVAKTIARVFPAYKSFLDAVIKEGLEPASSFPKGRYPKDKYTYLNDHVVEFTTPANTDGFGVKQSFFKRNAYPISGVAILRKESEDDDDKEIAQLLVLCVRLQPDKSNLARRIITQFERDAGVNLKIRQ